MKILDATCGMRSIWFQKKNGQTVYMDQRNINYTWENSPVCKLKNRRKIPITPMIQADFTALPYKAESFDLIVFDPPHIVRPNDSKMTQLKMKYGQFFKQTFKQILKDAFKELFRVLKPTGTLIFKWSERDVKINDILPLSPYPPMFGTRTSKTAIWLVFIKRNTNATLEEFE